MGRWTLGLGSVRGNGGGGGNAAWLEAHDQEGTDENWCESPGKGGKRRPLSNNPGRKRTARVLSPSVSCCILGSEVPRVQWGPELRSGARVWVVGSL